MRKRDSWIILVWVGLFGLALGYLTSLLVDRLQPIRVDSDLPSENFRPEPVAGQPRTPAHTPPHKPADAVLAPDPAWVSAASKGLQIY